MIRFLKSQLDWLVASSRRFLMAVMVVLTVTSTVNAVRLKYFQAELYYSYQGTTGPYEVLVDTSGTKRPGRLLSTVTAGEQYGWVIDYCLDEGISVAVESQLVRLAQDGTPEQIVDSRITRWGPADRRCGPIMGGWRIPEGARPGSYEVRRTLIFREGSMFALRKRLDAIHLQVSSVPFPPPAAQPAPAPVPSTNKPMRVSPSLLIYREEV